MFTGRKFFMTLVIISALCLCASACAEDKEAQRVRVGAMKHDMTSQEFRRMLVTTNRWSVFDPSHQNGLVFKFYEEFIAMMMALSTENIDEVEIPRPTGEYIISMNPEYKISCVMRSTGASFVFGFLKNKGEGLRDKFNKALSDMRTDRTLDALRTKYFSNPSKFDLDPVAIKSFPGAETIKVAVTGDVPPIDYVTADDQPAGFNTAILAEIGERLNINIELLDISASARTAALTSGRVDVVFWYITMGDDKEKILGVPDSVIVSDPYYSLDTFVHVRHK